MLIPSPRHTRADLEHWRQCEDMDRSYLRRCGARLDRLTDDAKRTIVAFAADGPCYVGTSWGKDSTVLAHLVLLAEVHASLVFFRYAVRSNPDCGLVRDMFMAREGAERITYLEPVVEPRQPGDKSSEAARFAQFTADAGLPSRRITGVRSDESSARARSAAVHGVATEVSCRPILRWSGSDVFAYLMRYDLPIHPAYACTFAGTIDRARVRVGPIGGDRGTGKGREEWERRYYREVTG